MNDRSQPIIVERSFAVSTDVLWQAITDRDRMVQWFFENIPAFEARVGFMTRFPVDAGQRVFTHVWKITAVAPGRKIEYDWRYEEYPGRGVVSFEVLPEGSGSKLRLVNTGLDSFPDSLPEFSLESCRGGWNYFIGERLPAYLRSLENGIKRNR